MYGFQNFLHIFMPKFSDIAEKYVWVLNVLTGKLNFII